MKTIEERAEEYFLRNDRTMDTHDAYSDGALQQRNIDIDKTIEWLRTNWRKYMNVDAEGMACFGHWENDYKKAMTWEN